MHLLKYIFTLILLLSTLINCTDSENKVQGVKLAQPEDPPPGSKGAPGPNSGIYLDRYKTCKAYSDYFLQQNWMIRIISPIAKLLNHDEPVHCQISHTCQCYKNIYFIDSNDKPYLYHCVEPPSAGIETKEIYTNKDGQLVGVIKFAKPRSLCLEK